MEVDKATAHRRTGTRRTPIHDRGGRRWIAAAVAAFALLGAACSGGSNGPGVAHAGSSKTPRSKSSKTAQKASALAYSQCMRDHGISDFPDPNSQGGITITAPANGGPGASQFDPNNPQFQAAQEACKSLLPGAGTPAQQADRRAQALKFAKCMRAHGISDFPDPNDQGGLAIKGTPSGDLDPNNPQFQAAQKACQHFLPGSGKGAKAQTAA